jgi:hypothetical protein
MLRDDPVKFGLIDLGRTVESAITNSRLAEAVGVCPERDRQRTYDVMTKQEHTIPRSRQRLLRYRPR